MYLTSEEIVSYNKNLILLFGGIYFEASDNIRNENSFNFLLEAPAQEMYGAELYPTIFDKAATYLFYIIKDHVFNDGNKRTGMMVAFMFLERNGFKIKGEIGRARIVRYAKRVAGCKPSIKNVSKWLRSISFHR